MTDVSSWRLRQNLIFNKFQYKNSIIFTLLAFLIYLSDFKELELSQMRSLIIDALKNYKNGKNEYGGGLQIATLVIEAKIIASKRGLKPEN